MLNPEKKKLNQSIARLKKGGKTFEIIVDCEEALKVKKGEGIVRDALLIEKIFKDAHKGDVQGDLLTDFNTEEVLEIAEEIITKGEVQLTEEYRHKIIEEKKNEIIGLLVRQAADPETHYPVPRQRVELGLEKLNYKVDFTKSVKEQVKELMNSLPTIMPITFKNVTLIITSPAKFSGQTYGIVKNAGEVVNQEYQPDGTLVLRIEAAMAKKQEIVDKLKKISHGLIKIEEE